MTVQAAVFRAMEFCRTQGQPVTVRDVAMLSQISEEGCRVAMKVFKERGLIRRVPNPVGAGRGAYFELLPDAVYAGDLRGRTESAKQQLEVARSQPRYWQKGSDQ